MTNRHIYAEELTRWYIDELANTPDADIEGDHFEVIGEADSSHDVSITKLAASVQQLIWALSIHLDAERQQREAAEAELTRVKEQSRNRLVGLCNAGDKREKAEAELAALRGWQEPVAWIKCGEVTTEPTTADVWIREMNEGYGYDVEVLCKRQPKPVVGPVKDVVEISLPGPYFGDRHCLDKREVVAVLEAAGIVVKDGE